MAATGDANQDALVREYRGAVAINNIGVALLRRQAFRQGMETLGDSMLAIKHVLLRSQSGAGGGRKGGMEQKKNDGKTIDVEASLHSAMQKLASPQCTGTTRSTSNVVDIVACSDNDLESMKSFVQNGHSPLLPSACPIRIDRSSNCERNSHKRCSIGSVDGDGTETNGNRVGEAVSSVWSTDATPMDTGGFGDDLAVRLEDADVEFESSIILYNYAVSRMCLGHASMKRRKASEKLFSGAYKLFVLNRTLLTNRIDLKADPNPYQEARCLLLLSLVMNGTGRILTIQGQGKEAKEENENLSNIISQVDTLDMISQVETMGINSRAASRGGDAGI